MFQHKSLFSLVKDLFNWIEGLGRSFTVRVQSEGERIFDLGGIRKKYLIRCQILRSKSRYSVLTWIAFQPSQGLNQMNWGSREEFHCPSTVSVERIFDLGWYEKRIWYVVKFRAQKLAIVFQHKSLFSLVKDLFNWIEGLGRSFTVRVQSEGERIFDLGGIRKKNLIRCQISRSKTGYSIST